MRRNLIKATASEFGTTNEQPTEPNVSEVFRDNANVWLEVEVATEVLTPRVKVDSSAFALNAKTLNGSDASAFATADHIQTVAAGGTGLTSPGASGNVLTSNGTGWASSPVSYTEADGVIGNEVNNATNATLTRSGSGTGASPYTLGLNLANANTWTGSQTFSSTQTTGVMKDTSGDAGTNGQLLQSSDRNRLEARTLNQFLFSLTNESSFNDEKTTFDASVRCH